MLLKGKIHSILRRMQKNATVLALIAALGVAFLLGAYTFRSVLFAPHADESVVEVPRAKPGVPTLRHPLSGYPLEKAVPIPRVYAVMIDHSVDAWPQSGVDKAFLVIEAPVEAGIPRLEAFFSEEQQAAKIGPIRSARPYFIDWADEFSALYVHVGGSDAALAKLAAGKTFDFNQYWNGASFWRSTDRQAPHNVYTSTQLLSAAWKRVQEQKKNNVEPSYTSWVFKDGAVLAPEHPVSPTIEFAAPSYRAHWSYNPATNRYDRQQGGLPYTMQDKAVVSVDNVAVVMTTISTIDEIGHREVKTIGQGDAFVFQDGLVRKGTWKKPSATERLRFYDEAGADMQINTGTTWIEVAPSKDSVTY